MACWPAKSMLTAVLIAAVALFCLGDLVQAAMPDTDSPCSTQLCDEQTGCGSGPAKTIVVPVAAVLTPVGGVTVTSVAMVRRVGEPVAPPGHQIPPPAPRAPPLV